MHYLINPPPSSPPFILYTAGIEYYVLILPILLYLSRTGASAHNIQDSDIILPHASFILHTDENYTNPS